MHSEYVKVEDIKTWLSFKCSVLRGLDLKDEDGIRTGAYRFYVHLKRDENSGELMQLEDMCVVLMTIWPWSVSTWFVGTVKVVNIL